MLQFSLLHTQREKQLHCDILTRRVICQIVTINYWENVLNTLAPFKCVEIIKLLSSTHCRTISNEFNTNRFFNKHIKVNKMHFSDFSKYEGISAKCHTNSFTRLGHNLWRLSFMSVLQLLPLNHSLCLDTLGCSLVSYTHREKRSWIAIS